MARKRRMATERFHVHLYHEDLEWLRANFSKPGAGLTISTAIAEIVHRHVVALKAEQQKAIEAIVNKPESLIK